MTLEFVLPLPANIGNSRAHWAAKLRDKKSYWQVLDNRVLLKQLPRPPRTPFARARLDTEFHHTHKTDADNREARQKWARDWLTTRGYIVDDGDAHLDCTPIQVYACRHLADRKLVLRLTPMEAAA